MNILFLMGVYPSYGGVEKVSSVLANGFVEMGYGVSIASFEQPHPELIETELNSAVKIYKLSYPVSAKSNIFRLNEILKSNNVDIIINQWSVPYYVARLCRKAMHGTKCKLISVHHNLPSTNARLKAIEIEIEKGKSLFINKIKSSIITLVSRLSLKYTHNVSDKFVVLSDCFIPIADKFIWGGGSEKIISITNPITINCSDSGELCEKQKEVVYVGRIEYNQKRTYRLVDIWRELEPDYPDWKLTIVGDGPDRDDLQKLILDSGLKNIKIEGFQDPVRYYQRASVLALVSEYEGFGLVIGEGMNCGVIPVVYGSYPSVYDIIDDRISGFITIPPYDLMAVVNRIKQLMDDDPLRDMMSEAALDSSHRFELSSVIKEWDKLFLTL